MQSKELVTKLRVYANGDRIDGRRRAPLSWKGQKTFALFFADYIESIDWSSREKYDFWRIELYLPQIVVDAFEHLRTGTDKSTVAHRMAYEEEVGHEVPNITDLGASYLMDQGTAVQTTLGFMLRDILGEEWIEKTIDTYCNAQKYVLKQSFDKFLRRVYRRGLCQIITECTQRGMSGEFGRTELRTYAIAGRLMFTFARPHNSGEWSVSFVAEEDDAFAFSAGIQSVEVSDFPLALEMIEDVITQWPADPEYQKKMFGASEKVSIV